MSKVELKVYNLAGEEVSRIEHRFFDVAVSDDVMSQVMRVYETNQHQGTKKAKNRGEVSRPDRKPWKQKGTGRARQGSRNSPIWVGGGVAHSVRPYAKRLTLPKRVRDLVMKYFIDAEIRANMVFLVESVKSFIKTKESLDLVRKLGIHYKKLVVVLGKGDEKTAAAFRNLANVSIRRAELLSPLDMSKKSAYVFTDEAYKILIDRVSKNGK